MITVPRLFAGETFAILGTGPSLCQADVDSLRGVARVIALNDAVTLAPWAECWYSSDQSFWRRNGGRPFAGLKYAIAPVKNHKRDPFPEFPDVQVINNTGPFGLELEPTGLRHAKNSGFAALGLAYHLGAARVLLLGYNMGPVNRVTHFNGAPASGCSYDTFARAFETITEPLKQAGVEVINCTEPTRLRCFPEMPLRDALARQAVAA